MATVTFQKNNQDVVDMALTPADFDADGLWHSDSVATTNDSRVTANVTFNALAPNGADVNVDYRLQAVLEGEEADGSWLPLVKQMNPTFSSENAPTRRLIATDRPTAYSPDVEHIIPGPLGEEVIAVTAEDVEIPSAVRICIQLGDKNTGAAALSSFNLTLRGSVS